MGAILNSAHRSTLDISIVIMKIFIARICIFKAQI